MTIKLSAAILSVALFTLPLSGAFGGDLVVIVNAGNGTDSMSASEVQKLFLGKSKKLPDGSKATLATLEPSASEFNKAALGKSDSQVRSAWSRLVFSGRAKPPKELGSAADVVDFVAGDADAVGYTDSDAVTGDVKVVYTVK